MKKVLLGLTLLSSVSSYANDVILKVGKSVVIEANTPTKILCESEHSKAPYFCRLNIVGSEVRLVMMNRNNPNNTPIIHLVREYSLESGSNAEIINQRSLTMINDELNSLVGKGICIKH